ncbi:MAG: ATP-binding protein [Opitutaceae bacterium]|jgi:predicted AAA+ superfamily ATPase|nr:ATP-binding protein [Opitutaceae bacterium]
MNIARNQLINEITDALNRSPVCLLQGPRQSGKTWLARQFPVKQGNYFDLENLVDQRRLENDPQGELARLHGLVVIDEAQRLPELFPLLRYLADRPANPARFLLLGSVAPRLLKGVTESLAGRVAHVGIAGFNVGEIEPEHHETLWVQGGLPPAFLKDASASFSWRLDYLRSLIELDLRDLTSTRVPPAALRRLLQLLAQSHGQVWNHAGAARLLSVDAKTVQRYIELLEGALLIRLLPPLERNLNKRLRKAPKLYFRDAGLAHALLSIRIFQDLNTHPLYGASWEGFALEQVIRTLGLREEECFTYAVHSGDEMDLVVERGGRAYGFDFKASASPGLTASMRNAALDLKLEHVFVVFPGIQEHGYRLSDNIEALPVHELAALRARWEIS